MRHKVYSAIVEAVRAGKLAEPFSNNDFRAACPGLGNGTYAAFLDKHSEENPGHNSALHASLQDYAEALAEQEPLERGLKAPPASAIR
jgi:hypothetical protein